VTINRVGELLAQYGLVLKAFNVLAVVSGAEEPLTPTAITGRTFVGKTTVTSVLDALERRRLVRRFPHPASRRAVLVEATDEGRQACDDILRRLHALETQWLAGMAEPDRQALLRLLGQVKKGKLSYADFGRQAAFTLTTDLRISYLGHATKSGLHPHREDCGRAGTASLPLDRDDPAELAAMPPIDPPPMLEVHRVFVAEVGPAAP
jgi:DNA-binding MarR family transcriptional regulator